MDELIILKTAFDMIKNAASDWALTEGNEKDGIWYVSGIVDVTLEILKEVKKS
jgi:hypothetical protein